MTRSKVSEWWYALTIQRRREILDKYDACIQDASSTYSNLKVYSKSSVITEFNNLIVEY